MLVYQRVISPGDLPCSNVHFHPAQLTGLCPWRSPPGESWISCRAAHGTSRDLGQWQGVVSFEVNPRDLKLVINGPMVVEALQTKIGNPLAINMAAFKGNKHLEIFQSTLLNFMPHQHRIERPRCQMP